MTMMMKMVMMVMIWVRLLLSSSPGEVTPDPGSFSLYSAWLPRIPPLSARSASYIAFARASPSRGVSTSHASLER